MKITKDDDHLPAVAEEAMEFIRNKEIPVAVKRRMECKGGGEVRRVHIIYFLSRMGRIEHPHLIRVHHLSRNGVHLRDVKRWLSELRGKDMPDSFSWSYKRRYKTGYVWQDLLDDDLITPISDNEYVLKGSEISAISFDLCSGKEKKVSIRKTEAPSSIQVTTPENPDLKSDDISTNKETQIDEDSGPLDSETSTESYESIRTDSVSTPDQVQDQKSKISKTTTKTEIEELGDDQIENSVEKLKKNEEEEVFEKKSSSSSTSSSNSSSSSFNKSKSYSSGATNVLRNLLNCRAVDTDDSAMMTINKSKTSSEICRMESTLGGSERISCGPWNPQHKTSRRSYSGEKNSNKSSEFGNQKKVSAAFKPVAEPHCS
ncbi:Protein of unknown function DUF966 [Macleaya cordata]|uniref:SOSEKI DIX-like domain-containing protein n=1 Tax=Macleaya cordata TaxID=56857 RepID=A0A200PMW6_MACCD|nr:Protein of unknown function DUF966 [Macleaya cordata]